MFLKILIFKTLYFLKKSAQFLSTLFIILVGLMVTLFSEKNAYFHQKHTTWFYVQLDQKILRGIYCRIPYMSTRLICQIVKWSKKFQVPSLLFSEYNFSNDPISFSSEVNLNLYISLYDNWVCCSLHDFTNSQNRILNLYESFSQADCFDESNRKK